MKSKTLQTRNRVLDILSKAEIYRDFERAFSEGTGLPLRLWSPDMQVVVRRAQQEENRFCSSMGRMKQACAQCLAFQRKCAETNPVTDECYAGLNETLVPVCIGEKVIAFLQTGHVFLKRPGAAQFDRLAENVKIWNPEADLDLLQSAYFDTRVLTPTHYGAIIKLLEIFARHLASCAEVLVLHDEHGKSPVITRARRFIEEHFGDGLSLPTVAHVVNMNPSYFCERFKVETGVSFVEYVSRVRVEKAKSLLQSNELRIGEIAFAVGFQSLSQFNRTFRRITAQSPREYRLRSKLS